MNALKVIGIGTASLLFSAGASAVAITDVGSYDTLLDSITQGEPGLPSSGEGNEELWIESVLGFDVTYTQLDGSSSGSNWEMVTGIGAVAGDYAFNFGMEFAPDYFLIKTGGGSGTGVTDTHFLYENNNSDNWAFLNLSDFGEGVSLDNVSVISHVGRTGGTVTVPEPGTLALLGLGLAGLGLSRRRKALKS